MNHWSMGALVPPAAAPTGISVAIPRAGRRPALRDFRCNPWPGRTLRVLLGHATGPGRTLRTLALCLILGAGNLAAETSVFDHPVTPASREALLAAAQRIASNPVVSGDFIQTKRITRLKKDFVSTGDFIFSGQDGVYWHVQKPFPSTIIMLSDKLVQKTANGKTSVMDAAGNAVFQRFADIIQAVFAGRIAGIENDFNLFYLPDGEGWRLGLVPREAAVRKVIAAMEIQGQRSIDSFRLTEANGDLVVYQFSGKQFPAQLDETQKQLFKY